MCRRRRSCTARRPTLVFLFNPFGATVLRRLLKQSRRQLAQRPGALDLLYVNNEQEGELERSRGFRRFSSARVRRSRADAIADHAILANQPDGEYACIELRRLLHLALDRLIIAVASVPCKMKIEWTSNFI